MKGKERGPRFWCGAREPLPAIFLLPISQKADPLLKEVVSAGTLGPAFPKPVCGPGDSHRERPGAWALILGAFSSGHSLTVWSPKQ